MRQAQAARRFGVVRGDAIMRAPSARNPGDRSRWPDCSGSRPQPGRSGRIAGRNRGRHRSRAIDSSRWFTRETDIAEIFGLPAGERLRLIEAVGESHANETAGVRPGDAWWKEPAELLAENDGAAHRGCSAP